ncbi:MAG TPA: hypothetical protein VH437_18445 [Terriglobales bacterium]
MSNAWLFVSGLVLTLSLAIGVVRYLRRPLFNLLVELCGSDNRAEFWAVFSSAILALVPLVFALDYRPSDRTPVFAIADQLVWALAGLVSSLLVLGWMLNRSIRRLNAKERV